MGESRGRWQHPRVLAVGILVAIVLAASGFAGGYFLRSADQLALRNSERDVVVTAEVQVRAAERTVVEGVVAGGHETQVVASLPPEVDRLVVTLAPYRSGDSVVPGTLLAEVSGQPLVALDLSTPLYRDLRLGMSGPDVASLKSGLASLGYSVNPYGDEFDSTVVAALNSLYLSLGYLDHVTKKSTISSGDFIDVSASDLIVTHAARLNSVLGEDEPVLSMAAATKSVTVRVDIVAAEPLVVGAKVRVRIPGTSIRRRGVIDHISGFKQAADDDSVPGHDVRIRLEKTLAPTQSGAGFTATLRGRQRPLPAVPLTALRSAGSEQFVWRAEADEFAQVDVTVREEADGWALLQQSGGLQPGDEVRVLP